ncbi:putative endonuclease [Halanaerobium saccharolyticum]|uniref:Putative endonuclease n=2 Tax=Halanaerobium saccharolyticum TaxID=43595 RepID=A0A4R6LAW1_9FIRM|nr:GIY-YIG nuclease family protein [Halanaerobium saccharolyticum]TDO73057.1 putative endonuclease [Halanaerobium saccharolyticum]
MDKNKEEREVIKNNKTDDLHYIYMVECSDGSLYTGYTTDVERRLEEHNAGQGAKYTRGRIPVKLRHQESFKNRSQAQKREYEIKQLPRRKKEELID